MATEKNYDFLQLDLNTYEQEPIHIPGSVQSHGVILTLKEPELIILQISNNTQYILGLSPEELLNQPLSKLLDSEQMEHFVDCLNQETVQVANPIELAIASSEKTRNFDGIVHRQMEVLILELEPTVSERNNFYFKFYNLVKQALSKLQSAYTFTEISQIIAKEMRRIIKFDRVMIYKFDEDKNGIVIAEDKEEHLTSYLGLHYPALDIPPLARNLFKQNWLRFIPNIDYQPAAIIPAHNPLTNEPLDLSHSVLRSVSPCHIEYLQNMGVKATMTISVIRNNKLWGLIACHHYTPKYVPYEIRHACEFLGQMTSLEIASKEDNEDSEDKIAIKSIQTKLVEYMSAEENFINGLLNNQPNILNLVNAQGAVVCFEDELYFIGNTPNQQEIQDLIKWISQNVTGEIFYTDSLPRRYPEAEKFKDVASGLIALSISKTHNNYVLWFRPEVLQTVNWGGDPNQSIEVIEDGTLRLSPRKSFELWKQTVHLKSLPWKPWEVNVALDLRSAIISIVLRKIDELAKLNFELERSNQELDAFAYIASHDLKEPLRGIHNYSNFLIEDYGEILNEEGKAKLKTLIRLTQRMEDLIDSLLRFSRLGRVDLMLQQIDLNIVLQRILDLLGARIEETGAVISIPRPLPIVYCDRIQLGEVFSNLITNAIKYNDKAEKLVEIGYMEASETVTFYVQDNGIGIREKHFEAIFRIFKRLHSPNKYGGGTGAGLTIAKKIVERHGGKIWVESTYGEGSTFYFTLQKAN
ncbi:ATP-binding protein [Chlorogloeopsis sp. ULAP01]|uniref:ATP-binding protein n=1 Tax=Chlorogloeopsis sp. ULAP01 TaxID=3056483 RepID=UPI0025AA7ECC|nr:ATP-binding protein [Chlorogloeopsis sp. ULAP01]MDM9380107.1 ATP-binding protein [Chlorogloeopsis sp. ULAP01]